MPATVGGEIEMEWYLILVLILGIPLILFPAAYVWYLNIGGIYQAVKEIRARKPVRREKMKAVSRKH